MPILITDYLSNESLELKVDGLIINSSLYSTFNDNVFSLTEIKNISKKIKEKGYLVIINCDRIIPQSEITLFYKFLDEIKKLPFDYLIYSDYSVLSFFDESSYDKLIYDSKTLVCTKEELEVIPTHSFISSELSLDEIKKFNESKKQFCLDCFGYRQMMYSRRPLLTLVLPQGKAKTNKLYDLVEETREENYKIYETKRNKYNYGTFIYNKGVYCLFEELKSEMNCFNNIFIFRLNSMFLSNIIKEVSLEYYKLVHGVDTNYQNILDVLALNNLKIDNSFLARESILLKEKEDE